MKCVVCRKSEERGGNSTFHRFPQNSVRRNIWLSNLNITSVAKTAKVCSDHFDAADYIVRRDGKKFLEPDAAPMLIGQLFPTSDSESTPPKSYSRANQNVAQLETDMQTSIKGEHSGVAKKCKAEAVPHLYECQDGAADDGAVASTSTDFMTYNNLSTLEEDESNEDDPDLLPDRPLVPVDESIVKIEIEEEPLKIKNEPFIIENDPLTSDTREESTLAQIKDEPSEKPDRLTSETVDQLDESERQSIQMFFDSMARTAMTLSPTFVSRIKSEVLRVVIDIEMEAYKKKMEDLKEPSRKTDTVNVASNETEPKIKIEIEDDAEAETTNELDEPQLLDPDHDANYEPLAKKKKKSKTEQPTSSSSALQVDRTPITLHEPVETFFQSIAYTVTSFPPPFICKAKVAVLNVISKMEVEACRSRQSGYQDGGGGGDASTTRHLLASGSDS